MQIEEAIEYLKMRSEKYKANKELMGLAEDIYGAEAVKEYDKKQEAIDIVLNQLEEQTEANKELNKVIITYKAMINEMAKYIIELIKYNNPEEERNIEEIKEYYYKKVSDNK